MKQKGFTLVELLAVLVLLVIIFMLVYPSVIDIVSESRETVYQKQINTILTAAYDFSLKNIEYLPEIGEEEYIILGQLKYEGLLPADIKDPNTNKNFPDNLVVSISNVGAGYKYSNENSMLEGNYLYTVESEALNNSDLKELLPVITLDDDLDFLRKNSDDNYIMTLNLNQAFSDVEFNATSYDGKNITNKVNKYILINDKVVEDIDSSQAGIYKINYSVVDVNGYASAIVLNVIVADTTPPTIYFPEDTIINKEKTNYDLMNQVNCEDNSGFCDIEYSGEIDFGVSGKYVIQYTAKDPSGNTFIKRRVIEIEK